MILSLGNIDKFQQVVGSGITLVDFYGPTCGPCLMMMPTLDQLSNEYPGINILKIDGSKQEFMPLLMNFRVQSIPRIVIFKDGEDVTHLVSPLVTGQPIIVGLQDLSTLRRLIEETSRLRKI